MGENTKNLQESNLVKKLYQLNNNRLGMSSFKYRQRPWNCTTDASLGTWTDWETHPVPIGCNATAKDGRGQKVVCSGSGSTVTFSEYTTEGCSGTTAETPDVTSSGDCKGDTKYEIDCKAPSLKGIFVAGALAMLAMSWVM